MALRQKVTLLIRERYHSNGMLYHYASIAYTFVNLFLALILLIKSRRNLLSRFYAFCVLCMAFLAGSAYLLQQPLSDSVFTVISTSSVFLFSLVPFFFLHFLVIFLRRYDILKSKTILLAIYFAGLFSYACVIAELLPGPLGKDGAVLISSYIYFVTWMSIFFSIGITLLYSHVRGFSERKIKSNLLLTGFGLLLLVLPSPFTYSLSYLLFPDNMEWYDISSTFALLIAVYLLFRHKILVTLYDSVKAALSVMNDLFIMTDEHFHIEVARGALMPMLGLSDREVVGKPLADLLVQKDYISSYLQYVRTGKMKECLFDAEVQAKDGAVQTINFSFSPVIENEQIAGFVGMGRNITDRKKWETTLRKSEEQYRDLVENISEGYYITDSNGRFIYASPNIFEHTGYRREELIGQSYVRLIAAEDRRRVVGFYVNQAKEGAQDVRIEFRIVSNQGTVTWVEQATRILRNLSGEVVEFRNIVRDISERRRSEEQIQLLARALESTTELICITDPRDRLVYANNAFLESHGYTVDEIFGRASRSLLLSPANPPGLLEEISRKTRQGRWNGEVISRRKDGTDFAVYLSTSQIKNREGVVIGFIDVERDITERKRLEDELRQAQKLESIGTLAGGIAHDFNNILAIILAYTSTLNQSRLSGPDFEHTISAITDAAQRGAGIVRELLTIAQKAEIKFDLVDVNASIEGIANLLRDTFPKTITFELALSPQLPRLAADSNQLQQALLNLCVNARDAMPSGGTLSISSSIHSGTSLREQFPQVSESEYAHLIIKDTGTGIQPEVRDHIFEPFFTTKERGKGTGLGLSVVYSIVSSHRGFVKLESEPGQGSCFHLFLPLPSQRVVLPDQLPTHAPKAMGGTETLLIVEDEELLLSLLKAQLERRGYSVLTARDGEEAVDMYEKNKGLIALVISDMGLPKLGGPELFRQMKSLDPNVRALFATGFLEPKLQEEMTREGARGFIQKPYTPEDVLRKIREVLDPALTKQ